MDSLESLFKDSGNAKSMTLSNKKAESPVRERNFTPERGNKTLKFAA